GEDIVVPVTKDAIALPLKETGAYRVGVRSLRVLATVDFNHDPRRMAREIDDVSPEPNLTAKMRVRERQAMAQGPPQLSLSLRRRGAHCGGAHAIWRIEGAILRRPDALLVRSA